MLFQGLGIDFSFRDSENLQKQQECARQVLKDEIAGNYSLDLLQGVYMNSPLF